MKDRQLDINKVIENLSGKLAQKEATIAVLETQVGQLLDELESVKDETGDDSLVEEADV